MIRVAVRGGHIAGEMHGPEGATPPLLLLPAAGGSSRLWGRFRDLLAREVRVISIDHRGSGRSSRAPAGLTTTRLARDAMAVIDDLGEASIDVFGLSLGGMVASHLAAMAWPKVRRLILASTPVRGRQVRFSAAGLATCLARSKDEVLPCFVTGLASHRFRKERPEELAAARDAARADRQHRSDLLAHLAAAARHDAARDLGRIRAATLVLVGDDDPLLSVTSLRQVTTAIPGAVSEVIEGAGHMLTLERPMETAARVLSFLLADAAATPCAASPAASR